MTVDGRAGVVIPASFASATYQKSARAEVVGTVSVNPPSIAGLASGTIVVTIDSAKIGDLIFFLPPNTFGATAGASGDSHLVLQGAAVTALNAATIRILNTHATETQDAPALEWQFILIAAS
jgi:hypothetical protein